MNHILKMSNAGGFTSATRYPDMLAGNTVWNPYTTVGSYDSIASITVGSTAQANITFSNIPSTYTHLQIRALVKTTFASAQDGLKVQFNGDTGSSYNYHYVGGNGSATYSGGNASATTFMQTVSIAGTTGSQYGVMVLDILDYANINKNKTMRAIGGVDANGSGVAEMWSGLYISTNAVNSINLYSYNGSNISQYSSFALYGVKA